MHEHVFNVRKCQMSACESKQADIAGLGMNIGMQM
jgi:hypothetical protein